MTTLREAALLALEALEYGHFAVADQAPHAGVMAYLEAIEIVRTTLDSNPQRKPLTVAEVEQILAQHNYAIHGDRAMYIVRMTESAHGIGGEE